jgi:hypothetical protein
MSLSFVVMNDSTKKVIFGAPVLKKHIESISLSKMSMKTWSGHKVPFSELDYGAISIPRVCSIKIGAEIKWKLSSDSIVLPDHSLVSLEPEPCDLDALPGRIVFDVKFVKTHGDKGLLFDLESLSTKEGYLLARVCSATAFVKTFTAGTALLTSTIKPGTLASF